MVGDQGRREAGSQALTPTPKGVGRPSRRVALATWTPVPDRSLVGPDSSIRDPVQMSNRLEGCKSLDGPTRARAVQVGKPQGTPGDVPDASLKKNVQAWPDLGGHRYWGPSGGPVVPQKRLVGSVSGRQGSWRRASTPEQVAVSSPWRSPRPSRMGDGVCHHYVPWTGFLAALACHH